MLDILHSERFVDKSPAEVFATLLDEEIYLCSVSSMYRILRANNEVKERRQAVRRAGYKKPELLATTPNQVWSWDITKLRSPAKWVYFYLYVVIDIFSRLVVGWMVAHRESAELAKQLMKETAERQNISESQLTIHSDRGSAMKSHSVYQLYADLGITRSLGRPSVSDDNPFSESHFKTLKYHPSFPKRFLSIEDAKVFCREFFRWYNAEHRHSGIGYYTPEAVHYGQAKELEDKRNRVLLNAQRRHPERFRKPPVAQKVPEEVWINPPRKDGSQNVNLN